MLVIAFGNPLRQDDGVGLAVARALEARRDLRVRTVHQLMPELAEALRDESCVVFVDAERGGPPGRVRRARVTASAEAWTGTHGLDPARLLGLCRSLYGRAPQASVVSIAGEHFGFGDEVSEPIRRAVPAAVRSVLRAQSRTGGRPA